MIWLALLLSSVAYAQIDLSVIQDLDEELPNYTNFKQGDDEININREERKFRPPTREISLEEIKQSGTELGAIRAGKKLRNVKTNENAKTTKLIYVRYYKLQDEHEFKYILSDDGTVKWKVRSAYVEPIKQELVMYEPPMRYTPAPDNIVRAEFDRKLTIPPEVSFYTGLVAGDFMKDLYNDNKARTGLSNQYGIHFFTQWKLPIKAGAVLHYERASYSLDNGGQVLYSSASIGPQFKTRDFELFGQVFRIQTQFRLGPLARATAKTAAGDSIIKFNSADLLASIEHPIKNRFGEFVLGLYTQTQWLNIRDQQTAVNIQASNNTNKSIGISFAQVFE